MRVAVIGGGIVGLASAYYLSKRGVDVTVFEKSTIGSGNTERSAGGIRAQFSTEENIRLSQESIAVWEQFESEFGTEIGYNQTGYLFVAPDRSSADQLRDAVEIQNRFGVESEFLTSNEAAEKCPRLKPDTIVGASFCPTDGYADPHLALQGFLNAAKNSGAEIRTEAEVTDVLTTQSDQQRVTGIETRSGRFKADYVVNAAGAWAGRVADMAGISLPLVPQRIQIAIIETADPMPASVPMTLDPVRECYFRPKRDGKSLVGGGTNLGSYEAESDPEFVDNSLDLDYAAEAIELVSEISGFFDSESKVAGGWAGLYALTPDHSPIIEQSLPGLISAVGMSGHGFMHSPATGKVVSELVTEGEASLIDISALTRDRFDGAEEMSKDLII